MRKRPDVQAAKNRVAARLSDPAVTAYRDRFGIAIHIPKGYEKPALEAVERAVAEQNAFAQAEKEKRAAVEKMFEERKGPAWKMFIRMLKGLNELITAYNAGDPDQGKYRPNDYASLVKEASDFVNSSDVTEGES